MRDAPWMLVTHRRGAKTRTGVLAGGLVREAPADLADLTILEILAAWDTHVPALRGLDPDGLPPVPDAELTAPLRFPPKVICAGANYYGHLAEMGIDRPVAPVTPYFFLKPPTTSVIGPEDRIVLPARAGRQIDWEVELAAVVGRRCADVPAEQALDVVAGWTIVNDVSARDLLIRPDAVAPSFATDWLGSKAGDTFCPMGPGVVPAWLVDDPQRLALRLSVNGVVKQDSTTADMVTPIAELVSAASRAVTLEPGDVIATGTPAGVGMPRGDFLAPGDETAAEIDGIGALRNPVVER